ncbi:MAG TPA: hypothetical protein VNA57_11785 [Acidimicrobiales bacterium]|nr:hypothetical protein [Acidimicrobiales bacterium]
MSDTIDHPRLLAEIDEEVRRRRESGDLPAGFERELDLVFARFAPVHAVGDDFAQVLERTEQSTHVDVLAPTASRTPAVGLAKRVIRKAVIWEMRYVAQQVSTFAFGVTRAVRLLGDRVDGLEQAAPGAGGKFLAMARAAAPALDTSRWATAVVDAVQDAPGRVVHAECGDGALVARMNQAGVDAYGVGPVDQVPPPGLEVRVDEALVHLRAVPDASLGGVVLSGCVDLLPLGTLSEMAALARAKLAPGGVAVVLATKPECWAGVAADLAPGRPLHPKTWCQLLGAGGVSSVEVVEGPTDYAVVARLPG